MTEERSFEEYLSLHGITSLRLSKKETLHAQQLWREVFALRLKKVTGHWNLNNHDWHVFSYDYAICFKGATAVEAFSNINCNEFRIVTFDPITAYVCRSKGISNIPEFQTHSLELDIYLSGMGYDWTMVFPHEQTLGPYFALKEWQNA
jgi:Domain of unknown function (DUF4275)